MREYWRHTYDPARLEARLNAFANHRWEGIHLIWERSQRGETPVVLIHGWPGGPIEFLDLIPRLVEAGHDVVVPSLPGFGFSEIPEQTLNIAAVAGRLRALVEDGLGYERYAVQGGDWGAAISARMAFEAPERVAALHVNAVSVLPLPPTWAICRRARPRAPTSRVRSDGACGAGFTSLSSRRPRSRSRTGSTTLRPGWLGGWSRSTASGAIATATWSAGSPSATCATS